MKMLNEVLNDGEKMKQCPYCKEEIKKDAIKCKHCGELLSGKMAKGQVCCQQCGMVMKKCIKVKCNQFLAWIAIIGGIALTPVIIGIPILLWGLYMGTARQRFWKCPSCGYSFNI